MAESDPNPISTLGVVGAGTMGHGIAQTAILSGVETTLLDIDGAALERAVESIENGLERLVSRDRISDADRNAALSRLQTRSEMTTLASVDAGPPHCDLALKPPPQVSPGFCGGVVGHAGDERLMGSAMAAGLAIHQGASIVRVHDVRAPRLAVDVASGVRRAAAGRAGP